MPLGDHCPLPLCWLEICICGKGLVSVIPVRFNEEKYVVQDTVHSPLCRHLGLTTPGLAPQVSLILYPKCCSSRSMFPGVIADCSGVVGRERMEGWGTGQVPALPPVSLPHVHRCCCCCCPTGLGTGVKKRRCVRVVPNSLRPTSFP